MRDELLAGRRTGQQRPGELGVEPDEVIGPVRRGIDLGLHLDKQRIYQALGLETLDDRHTSRGKRRSNIGCRRVRSSGTVGHAETVVVTPSVSGMCSFLRTSHEAQQIC